MTEIKWCKLHLVWSLEERDLEKKNIIMLRLMLWMVWEGHGKKEDAPRILAWRLECIKLQSEARDIEQGSTP